MKQQLLNIQIIEENKVETKENKSDQTPKQESIKAKTGDDTQI